MKQSDLFEGLVENALGFLSHAIEALESEPKFSVIDFYTALELFLKARLLHEHWSLVVAKDPDWDKFVSGDFVSVGFDEACVRLDKVVRSSISPRSRNKFNAVRRHRNKLVHFFHAGERPDHQIIEQVAIEQLSAWYELHQLIMHQWKNVFAPWEKSLARIETKLTRHKKYLVAKFEGLSAELERIKASGTEIGICRICNFRAAVVHKGELAALQEGDCLVCSAKNRWFLLECPGCAEVAYLFDGGQFSCNCGYTADERQLVDILDQTVVTKDDYFDNSYPANCGECEGYHTVVACDEKNLCIVCLDVTTDLNTCEFCNEANTGSMADSYFKGCGHCDGKAGWDAGKDD
jgi:hypothetical protein